MQLDIKKLHNTEAEENCAHNAVASPTKKKKKSDEAAPVSMYTKIKNAAYSRFGMRNLNTNRYIELA